jgi:hypothetical protein
VVFDPRAGPVAFVCLSTSLLFAAAVALHVAEVELEADVAAAAPQIF